MGGIDYIRKGEHQAALDRIMELEALLDECDMLAKLRAAQKERVDE